MTTTQQQQTWEPRAPLPGPVKLGNLRRGLLWTYGVVQAGFLAVVIGIYAVAASEMTGEPFNDLGVAIGRELALNEVYGWWLASGLGLAVVFGLGYLFARERWSR